MASSSNGGSGVKKLTRAEVAMHKNSNTGRVWMIIDNGVYDVTDFLGEHPGGVEILAVKNGEDCTQAFEENDHSTDAREMLKPMLIGEIVDKEKWEYDDCDVGEATACNDSIEDMGLVGEMLGESISARVSDYYNTVMVTLIMAMTALIYWLY